MRFFLFIVLLACGSGDEGMIEQDPQLGVMWQSAQRGKPCDWLKIFDNVKTVKLSFLWGSYGSDNSCLNQLANTHSAINLRIFLSNGVCLRKRNCSKIEIESPSEIEAVFKDVIRWAKTCNNCNVELVPQLEDNWNHNEACQVLKRLKKIDKSVKILRNPVSLETFDNSHLCFDGVELHFPSTMVHGPRSYSNDGKALLLPSSYAYSGLHISLSEAREFRNLLGGDGVFHLWHPLGNCLTGDTKEAPYPYLRRCENRLDIFEDLNQILIRGLK